MLTYFWGNIKAICILFVLLVSSCYNIVYAEDMGRDRAFCYPGAPGKILLLRHFLIILVR